MSTLIETINNSEIMKQTVVSLLLVVITAIVTHLFDVKKIKEQQRMTLQESVEKRIVEACIAVRDLQIG